MEQQEAALGAWELRLLQAEAELVERAQRALADGAKPGEMLAFAAEHDKIALDRDTIAGLYDDQASDRDRSAEGRERAAAARNGGPTGPGTAAGDRDEAAHDREESHDARERARAGRELAAADRDRAASDRDLAVEKEAAQEGELTGLRSALESRLLIGQAQGLLMARHGITSETAFSVLVRLSQQSNVKLREVAAHLVAEAEPESP